MASVLLVGLFDVTVRLTTEPVDGAAAPSPTTAERSSPTTSTTTTPSTTTPPRPAPPPTAAAAAVPSPPPAPPPSGWPTAATTGARNTAALTPWTGSCSLTTANQVIENAIFDCAVDIQAAGVTIRNSVVRTNDEWGVNVGPSSGAAAVIEDVTIEAASGCNTFGGAMAFGNYHASRVRVVNFGYAFVAWQNNTIVQDSYAKLCGPDGSGAESTGIEGYQAPSATGDRPYVFDHNTIDQRCSDWRSAVPDANHPGSGNPSDQACDAIANVTWFESGNGLQLTNNLFRGGEYAIDVDSGDGHTVTGNVVERASYAYGAVYECFDAAWSNNREADVTDGGAVSNETPLPCGG
ncbi:MAG: hypothetical protein ACRD2C_15465 [Acidimicrobiales bacterium]